jgi:hypothetical protein
MRVKESSQFRVGRNRREYASSTQAPRCDLPVNVSIDDQRPLSYAVVVMRFHRWIRLVHARLVPLRTEYGIVNEPDARRTEAALPANTMTNNHDTSEVPRDFWSEYSEQPFETCVQCESRLYSDPRRGYIIQKHVVAGETVFEMAICVACAHQLHEEFSDESRRSLNEFVRQAPERRRREADSVSHAYLTPVIGQVPAAQQENLNKHRALWQERALSSCAICAKLRSECHRYSFGTACLANGMFTVLPGPEDLGSPFLICEDCELQLNECVSTQTRDAWDRFVEDNFDGPPELSVDPHELTLIF